VRCARAAHNDGEDVDFDTWPVVAYGVCEGCVFVPNQVGCLGEVVVSAVLPFPYLNFLNRRVYAAAVSVTDISRFEEANEIGFVRRGS
jgi:hypothetical protein